jgi:dTDP-4-dehydrorhamnose 3,5-epimerase
MGNQVQFGLPSAVSRSERRLLLVFDGGNAPGYSSGVRWNDPAIQVSWPMSISIISTQDQSWPEWT